MVSRTSFQIIAVLCAALGLRLLILAQGAVTFDSDEAVVALMARHIVAGQWPVFYYGQSYMGSLDATLIAAAFALLGQSVLVIRLVQTALYLGTIATTFALGDRLLGDRRAAIAAALLMALPTVLVSTYTTATLGGYGEILLLGNLSLLLGHKIVTDGPRNLGAWLALGAVGGLGFWTSALIGVYLLPIALLILASGLRKNGSGGLYLRGTALAGAAFLVSSAPWWWHNLTYDWSAVRFLVTAIEPDEGKIQVMGVGTKLIGLGMVGLPALMGVRFPWATEFLSLPLSAGVVVIQLGALAHIVQRLRRDREPGVILLIGVGVAFTAMFLGSWFGTDATGRYFLPLAVVSALGVGSLVAQLFHQQRWLAVSVLAYLIGFNLLANGMALRQDPHGLTTQLDANNRFDNTHDEELIEFLREINVTRGYSSYFVVYRIAFLSSEEIILSAQLPYRSNLDYDPANDRYPVYRHEVETADDVVYITAMHPALDELLNERLLQAGIDFAEKEIGPYRVFYDLARKVTPQELGFGR